VTLWRLPEDIEDTFDANWEGWLEDAPSWNSFFDQVAAIASPDPTAALRHFDLVAANEIAFMEEMKTAADGRAISVPGLFPSGRGVLQQLALGFSKASRGSLVVPFARVSA
jgi:hypothetical protein